MQWIIRHPGLLYLAHYFVTEHHGKKQPSPVNVTVIVFIRLFGTVNIFIIVAYGRVVHKPAVKLMAHFPGHGLKSYFIHAVLRASVLQVKALLDKARRLLSGKI